MTLSRRQLFTTAAIVAFTGAGSAGAILSGLIEPAKADAPEPDQAELAKAGPEGDIVLGSDKAPVTIIEYASMTCPHCAHFSTDTFPELQKRYIDTGKVRYIFREFPLDALAAAGFMLARCAGKDKFMPVVETLFAKQPEWMVQKPIEPLKAIAKQFGFTEQSFDACLANQHVLDGIQEVRDRAAEKLGINSVPTFFVNGQKLTGDQSIDALAKVIDPYLKQG
ncbi:MAG: DsbA family protein [Xanthobacteraceae bacterium]